MSGHIASVVCFVTVLMTSHDVNGQTHDVAQLNRKLTMIKNSIDGDIVDIRFDVMELKMIVEQIVVGQRNASDGSIIGQGMTAGVNQKEITDLKDMLNAHENRLNRLFSTEKKCEDRINALQKQFDETLAAMMKGYKKLKAHVTDSVVDQIHNLSQSVISEQNKLSSRIDHADAKIVRLVGDAAVITAGNKDLEMHMSVQINNLSQSVISEQNKLSARIDHADTKIVTLAGGANRLDGFSRAIGKLNTRTDKCCTEVDYCAPNPCEHGTCVNGRTNYTCVCDPSHTGRNCTEVDHCPFNPCVFGICFNGRTGYICVCQQHYTGRNCSEVDYCAPNPCEHGTCVNGRTNYTCVCDPSHTGRNCTELTGKDCLELRTLTNVSGVYRVRPAGMIEDIEVYCDMATDGGGWTVFQRRVNGSVDFYQNFSSYENGFGNVHGEHWLGLKYIYAMTCTAKTELRIDLMAADGSTAYEVFPNFRLSAAPNYTLHVDKGHGTAGDGHTGLSYHNGYRFSTYDNDDANRCAQTFHGGWWFYQCVLVHLNGRYVTPGTRSTSSWNAGIVYYPFKQDISMKETKMMFKRV